MNRILLPILLSLLSTGAAFGEKLQILTTFAPIDSLTRSIVGDAAEVTMLLPPGTGPHDFAFAPSDVRLVAKADVVVINGLGMEDWMEKAIVGGTKKGAIVIDTSKGIKTLKSNEVEGGGDAHDHHGHDHGHSPGGVNPHIWLDPQRAMRQAENIVMALSSKDPANVEKYKANTVALLRKLEQLDRDIAEGTATLPNKQILTFHDSFPYFAERYGFDIVGVFEPFPGREPSPKYILQLQKTIKDKNVKAIFTEPQYSSKMIDNIARDSNVAIASLDPMETGEPSADLYEKVMRANLASLQKTLNAK